MTACSQSQSHSIMNLKLAVKNTRFVALTNKSIGNDRNFIIWLSVILRWSQMHFATRFSHHSTHDLSHRIICLHSRKGIFQFSCLWKAPIIWWCTQLFQSSSNDSNTLSTQRKPQCWSRLGSTYSRTLEYLPANSRVHWFALTNSQVCEYALVSSWIRTRKVCLLASMIALCSRNANTIVPSWGSKICYVSLIKICS